MRFKIKDPIFSWAWTPWWVQQSLGHKHELILPGKEVEPALAHFSRLEGATEVSWLWLFENEREARQLRLLPEVEVGFGTRNGELDLIEATIPRAAPGEETRSYIQKSPLKWLKQMPLVELGITEIWYGFNLSDYIKDRRLRLSTVIMEANEFLTIARR
jgi:hypothetical protein